MTQGLIGALLLAQLMVAAYACPLLLSNPSGDNTAAAARAAGPFDDPVPFAFESATGLDGSGATIDSASPNLCGDHCKAGQQSDQAPTIRLPATLPALRYVIPSAPPAPSPARAAPAEVISALVAAAPPHAILHCVLRT